MPIFLQGDIFQAALEFDGLTLVFGHVGYNQMAATWNNFRERVPAFADIADPFPPFAGPNPRSQRPSLVGPEQFQFRQWIWFVREQENRGMTDDMLRGVLRTVLEWAQTVNIRRIMTNGIPNVDHGLDPAANRLSDDRRTDFLVDFLTAYEPFFQFTLISLDGWPHQNPQ